MTGSDMVRRAADRRADHGYTLEDLHADDPPPAYDTGEVSAKLELATIRHPVGEMTLDDTGASRPALVYPLVQRDELTMTTEIHPHDDEYAAARVVVEPDDAREIAAAIWQAAEDVEQLRAEGAGATPGDPDAEADSGDTVGVRFSDEQLAAARERLPADADALDARDALADLAEIDTEYRTEDGRDAIAAVLAETDE